MIAATATLKQGTSGKGPPFLTKNPPPGGFFVCAWFSVLGQVGDSGQVLGNLRVQLRSAARQSHWLELVRSEWCTKARPRQTEGQFEDQGSAGIAKIPGVGLYFRHRESLDREVGGARPASSQKVTLETSQKVTIGGFTLKRVVVHAW